MGKENLQTVLLTLLLGLIPFGNSLFAQPKDVAFRNLGPGDGLPVTSVTSVTQDISGIIWIGSWDGVYSYDGKQFTKKNNSGRYVSADKKGGVWIAVGNGKLLYFNTFTDSIKTYEINTNRRYTDFVIDYKENVWACSPEGILKLNSNTDSFEIDSGQKPGNTTWVKVKPNGDLLFYYADSANDLFIGQRNTNGNYSYESFPTDLNNPVPNSDFAKEQFVYTSPYNSSGILILNKHGWAIRKSDADDWHFIKPVDKIDLDDLDAAIPDSNNNLWFSFQNSLLRLNPESGETVSYIHDDTNTNSLLSQPVLPGSRLFIDRQGILWIPRFSSGISLLNLYESDFGLVKNSDGKIISGGLSALEEKDGSYWIGSRITEGSLVHFFPDGSIIEQFDGARDNSCPPGKSVASILSHPFMWALAQSADGTIWVGTGDPGPTSGGLNRIRPGSKEITRFKNDPNDPSSLPRNWVRKISIDGSNRLWLYAYPAEDIYWFDPETEKFTTYSDYTRAINPRDSNVFYYPEMVTSKGNVILKNLDGSHRLVHHKDLSYTSFGPIKSRLSAYSFEDSKGHFWFISEDGFGYLDSSATKIDYFYNLKQHNFPASSVHSMQQDNAGIIWLATDNGIIRFDPSTEKYLHFSYTRGLQENNFDGAMDYKGPSGRIYFGGTGGSNIIDPDKIITNPFPPEMVFTGLKLDGEKIQPGTNSALQQPIEVADNIVVGPEVSTFSLDFSAIHFAGFQDNKYEYMLEGFDTNWQDGGTQGNATYTNLPPGKYTFRIKGSNWDGVWSDGTKSIKIRILPPWWRTWWAYIIYGIMLIVAIFFFDRYRKKRLLEKERALARERELEQAREIEKAYKELEVTHENLKSTQTQLIQSEKMASLGELTAGIAHEIQNPLNFVNNFSEVSNELIDEMNEELENGDLEEAKAISSDIKQNLEKINYHGKRADSIVKGMLLHSRGNTGQKELTDINALCDEYLRLSYHGFRAKDKSFNADFRLETDESLPKIEVVPQEIGRVLLNLVNNAFYAVNEKVKQEANSYKPLVVVQTICNGKGIEIRVKDNGSGIPDSLKEKIFQPFFTTKPTGQGTGLGLSLSYDIVKAHGGEMKIETSENRGTEFILLIPSKL